MTQRDRRQKILESARVLFREKGYHATTIRDIADRSGLLSGSLYAHIKTKEDLLFEITDEVAKRFIRAIQEVQGQPISPTDKFRKALTAHIRIMAERMDAAVVFSHEWKALSTQRREQIQSQRDRYEDLWAQIIDEGIQAGEFREEHSRFARMVTLSVANWLYQWYDPLGALPVDEVADRLGEVILRGLHK